MEIQIGGDKSTPMSLGPIGLTSLFKETRSIEYLKSIHLSTAVTYKDEQPTVVKLEKAAFGGSPVYKLAKVGDYEDGSFIWIGLKSLETLLRFIQNYLSSAIHLPAEFQEKFETLIGKCMAEDKEIGHTAETAQTDQPSKWLVT